MAKIRLEKMDFYAFHGCFAEEQAIGTHFCVDMELEVDTSRSQTSDELADTVNLIPNSRMRLCSSVLTSTLGTVVQVVPTTHRAVSL